MANALRIPADLRPLVLVVEDELLLSDIIADELEDAGYRVITFLTGEEGLIVLEGPDPVDLLFTDIRLPGKVDGWRLAEAARSLRPGLPIVYASGYSVEQPREVPGSRFLTKPYRPSAVVTVFEQLGVVGQPE
jgi:CheY-like chemotaxis protein